MSEAEEEGFQIRDEEQECISCSSTDTTRHEFDKNSERRCNDCGTWFTRCMKCNELTISKYLISYSGFRGNPFWGELKRGLSKSDLERISEGNSEVEFDGKDELTVSVEKEESGYLIDDNLNIDNGNCECAVQLWKCNQCGEKVIEDLWWHN